MFTSVLFAVLFNSAMRCLYVSSVISLCHAFLYWTERGGVVDSINGSIIFDLV